MKRYLPEHATGARLALELAKREAAHLAYTHRTLFANTIDLEWVQSLSVREDLSEKIDAFVGRFGRLQDHLGEKLLPKFCLLVGANKKSLLDVLADAERLGWIADAEAFVGVRRLRNLLIHEYMTDQQLFLNALHAADHAARMLMDIVERLDRYATDIDLP